MWAFWALARRWQACKTFLVRSQTRWSLVVRIWASLSTHSWLPKWPCQSACAVNEDDDLKKKRIDASAPFTQLQWYLSVLVAWRLLWRGWGTLTGQFSALLYQGMPAAHGSLLTNLDIEHCSSKKNQFQAKRVIQSLDWVTRKGWRLWCSYWKSKFQMKKITPRPPSGSAPTPLPQHWILTSSSIFAIIFGMRL